MKRFITFVSVFGLFFSSVTPANPPQAFHKIDPANAATGVANDLLLTWEESSDVLVYEYCYDTSNDDACTGWLSAGPNPNVSLNGLADNTTYYWQVRAVGPGGTTYADSSPGEQTWWHFTTQALLPGAFHKLAPGNNAVNVEVSPTLRWETSPFAIRYEYCLLDSNTATCEGRWTDTGSATSVSLPRLANQASYVWMVRAVGLYGITYADNGPSDTWHFTTASLPGGFTKTAPENGSQAVIDTPTLTWQASPNASRYEYCLVETTTVTTGITGTLCSPGWINVGSATSALAGALKANTTYSWQVRATGPGGTTYANNQSAWLFTTLPSGSPPLPFDKINPSDQAQQVPIPLFLNWGPSGSASRYEYCIDTTADDACSTGWVSAGTNNKIPLYDLHDSTTYYWQVRAWSPGGTTYANGNSTAYWRFTTLISLPGDFRKIAPYNFAVNISTAPVLSWEDSPNATSYEYCLNTISDIECTIGWINVGQSTSVQISGLNKDTTYYWQVRAINQTGPTYANGVQGNIWQFTTLSRPAPFYKSQPENMASSVSTTAVSLSWTDSSNLTNYAYCIDTIDDSLCNTTWNNALTRTNATLTGLAQHTTYFWQVRADGPGGTSYADEGAWWRFTTETIPSPPPGAFQKKTPPDGITDVTTTPTSLEWTTSSNATNYAYCIDTSNNNTCNSTWRNNLGSTSAAVDGLLPNTTYYWQVRASGTGGTGDADNGLWWHFTTRALPPAPPGAFQKSTPLDAAAGITTNPTRLSWTTSSNATSYAYCIDTSDNNGCNTTWRDNLASTSASVTDLLPETTYYWQVRASGPGGTSDANNGTWFRFTTQALPPVPPGAFQKSTPPDAAISTANNPTLLEWTLSSNAANYTYCIDTSDNKTCNTTWRNNLGNTSAAVNGLLPGTTYYWQVRAEGPGGTAYADGGTWWRFTTQAPVVPGAFRKSAPSDAATGIANNPTRLEWKASSNATGYAYCIDTSNNNACNTFWRNNLGNTTATPDDLERATTYFWQVRAASPDGTIDADDGSWWHFTTLPAAPAAFSLGKPAEGAVKVSVNPTLTWSPSTGASSYEYCLRTADQAGCPNGWVNVGNYTSAAITGLAGETTYFWLVRAVGEGGLTEANGGAWRRFTTGKASGTVIKTLYLPLALLRSIN